MAVNINMQKPVELHSFMKLLLNHYYEGIREHGQDGSRKIAWCTSAGPVELLRAMDFDVYFPEKHWEMLGCFDAVSDQESGSFEQKEPPRFHSFLVNDRMEKRLEPSGRESIDQPSRMDIPEPDLLVFNTIQGKGIKDWMVNYSKILNKPVIGIYTPHKLGEINKNDVKSIIVQLRNLVLTLEAISGRKFDIDRFKEIVGLSRKCAESWQSCLQTAAYLPSPWSYFEQLELMAPAVILRGLPSGELFYQLLFTELVKKINSGIQEEKNQQVRLIWKGLPLLCQHTELKSILKSMNACIVASTSCNMWNLCELEESQPFSSMARAYAELYITRNVDWQCMAICKLKKDFRADGILVSETSIENGFGNQRQEILNLLTESEKIPLLKIDLKKLKPQPDQNQACYSEIQCFINELKFRTQNSVQTTCY